ncbi:hypothetical protein ACTJLB_09090 [Paraburkholderia sp. 22098]|uniref:hypothetical protein n=1 Tax=Paraburkholderia sp. 22098 TaxID=3453874 RepID=UPI003F8569EA
MKLFLMALVVALAQAGVCAYAQAVPPDPTSAAVASLREQGVPGESPVIQSIVGFEFGVVPTNENKGGVSVKDLAALADKRNANLPPVPLDQDQDPKVVAKLIAQRMQDIRNQLFQAQTGLAAARTIKPELGTAGMLVDQPGSPIPRLSETTVRIQAGTLAIAASDQFQQQAPKLQRDYTQAIQDLLVIAAIHAASPTVDGYTSGSVTNENVQAVVQTILGANNVHLPPEVAGALSQVNLQDLANAPATVVSDAIGRYVAARTSNSIAAEEGRATAFLNTSTAATDVTDVRRELLSYQDKAQDGAKSIVESFSSALHDEADALSDPGTPDDTHANADVAVAVPDDTAIWGQLSPREKLEAMDDGAYSNLSANAQKSLQVSLGKADDVLAARDQAIGDLAKIGQIGRLAASLGVPIDTYNLSKNIDTASTAINVAASIATGNWMGALSSATGLIGGGQTDPTGAALSRVSEQLGQVVSLQRQTLMKLDDLSRQIQSSTQAILSKLEEVQRLELFSLQFEEDIAHEGFTACENFVSTAQDTDEDNSMWMHDGVFPSYNARRTHFLRDDWARNYHDCVTYLDDVKDVKQRSREGRAYFLSTVFLANDPGSESLADNYQNMLTHTRHLLGIPDMPSMPNCMKRLTWAASLGARYFSDINVAELTCARGEIPESALNCDAHNQPAVKGDCKKLRLSNRNANDNGPRDMDYKAALSQAAVPENVQEVGEIILFVSTWPSFIKGPEYNPVLLTETELATGVQPMPSDRKANQYISEWPAAFMNVVNVAVAQESISAGSLVTEETTQVLQQAKYGETAAWPTDPNEFDPKKDPAAAAAMAVWFNPGAAKVDHVIRDGFPQKYWYAATEYLMQNNATYAGNVVRYLVAKRLSENGVTRPVYAFATRSSDSFFITDALRDKTTKDMPPLVFLNAQTKQKDGTVVQTTMDGKPIYQTGWHLKLKKQDGTSFYVPLPTVTTVWANTIAYMPSASGLFRLRDALMDRMMLTSPGNVKLLGDVDPAAPRLLNLEALGDKEIGQSPFSSELLSTRTGRTKVVLQKSQ